MCVRCAAAKEKSLKSKSKWIINMCTVANWPPYTAADTIPPFYCRHSLFSPSFVCLFWNGSPMRELHYLTACITNVSFFSPTRKQTMWSNQCQKKRFTKFKERSFPTASEEKVLLRAVQRVHIQFHKESIKLENESCKITHSHTAAATIERYVHNVSMWFN